MGKYGISGEKGYRAGDEPAKKPKCELEPHLEKMRSKFDAACIAPRSNDQRWANSVMDGTIHPDYSVLMDARKSLNAEIASWHYAFCTKTGRCSVPCETQEKAERIAAKKMDAGVVFCAVHFLDTYLPQCAIVSNKIATSQNWLSWFTKICDRHGFAFCFVSDSRNTYLEVVYIHQQQKNSTKLCCFDVIL